MESSGLLTFQDVIESSLFPECDLTVDDRSRESEYDDSVVYASILLGCTEVLHPSTNATDCTSSQQGAR